jgi:hypothetical protein
MVRFLWLILRRGADFWPEIAFKRTSEGWVFKMPNRWLFGSPQYYLLDDAQKSEIEAVLRHPSGWRWWSSLVVLSVLLMALVFLVSFLMVRAPSPVIADLLLVLGGLLFAGLFNLNLYWRVQPLLAGAALTTERIRFTDQFVYTALHLPVAVTVILALFFTTQAVVQATYMLKIGPDSISQMIVATAWGLGAMYFIAQLIVRLKMRRAY